MLKLTCRWHGRDRISHKKHRLVTNRCFHFYEEKRRRVWVDVRKVMNKNLIRILFQPIQNVNQNKIIGYEALARGPVGSQLEGAKKLFESAKDAGLLEELEMECFRLAVTESRKLINNGNKLFINFSPKTLSKNYKVILKNLYGLHKNTVIEITETSSKIRYIFSCVNHLKESGVKIALDDIGGGDRGYSNIVEAKSDYFKIDREIIQGLTKYKNGVAEDYKALMRFLVELAGRRNVKVIAEGVETENQLHETMLSGAFLVQGFYFAKPQPAEYWIGRKMESL